MAKMKILAVVTPPSIYHGCSTWKTFCKEHFTGEENVTLGEISAMNMKSCGFRNVRQHREIKGSDKYFTMYISLKFDSLDKMRITSSESKVKLGRSVNDLINYLSIQSKRSPNKY